MKRKWIAMLTCIAVVATYVPAPVTAQEAGDPVAVDQPGDTGPPAHALEPGAEIERWNWQKFWDYAACGAAIALATGGAGAVAVVIACGRVISLYWTT